MNRDSSHTIDMSQWAKLPARECDHYMQVIHALDDLSEIWLEEAGIASGTGEKNYEMRDMHAHNVLTKARNDLLGMVRALGPNDYFQTKVSADPMLLTAARDKIRQLQKQIEAMVSAAKPLAAERETAGSV